MNTESIDCRRIEPGKFEGPGDFCIQDGYCYVWLPGGTGPDAIKIVEGPDPGIDRVWAWDGNEDKPTLTPSILSPIGPKWHGYMTAGRLVSC